MADSTSVAMSLKAIRPVKASTKALKVQMNGRVSQVVKKKKKWIQIRKL